jgi:Flp pilus assembly pilin Flp
MHALRTVLSGLWQQDEGATMVEYALLISLIALTAFAGAAAFGSSVQQLYQHIRNDIVTALR